MMATWQTYHLGGGDESRPCQFSYANPNLLEQNVEQWVQRMRMAIGLCQLRWRQERRKGRPFFILKDEGMYNLEVKDHEKNSPLDLMIASS